MEAKKVTHAEQDQSPSIRQVLTGRGFSEKFFQICQERFGKYYKDGVPKITKLQSKCFQDERFWMNENIIIQGPTSAGKTFIGEIAALWECQHSRSTIFLVPLRSMVKEKYDALIKYYSDTEYLNKIYASSSDYQENDFIISSGNFNIAVIVYEKFLALRADSTNNILKRCGLVIVDELQMLSDDRGAKLETALVDIMMEKQSIRFLGLSTNSCDMRIVAQWLGSHEKAAYCIHDDERPVSFIEYVINLDGAYKCRELKKERGLPPNDYDGVIDDVSVCLGDKAKLEFLKRLITKLVNDKATPTSNALGIEQSEIEKGTDICNRCAVPKILIFSANRENVKERCGTVKNLVKNGVIPSPSLTTVEKKRHEFDSLMLDEEESRFFNTYMQYGVMFHHAGLSHEIRQYIEDEFRKEDSILNFIVATETLTVGINMPFDIVIIFNPYKPDGKGGERLIYPYEYKNYIGRAGRFGFEGIDYADGNYYGKSYLLADNETEKHNWFKEFVQSDKSLITSSIHKLDYASLAPYVLSWIAGQHGGVTTKEALSKYIGRLLASRDIDDKEVLTASEQVLEYLKQNTPLLIEGDEPDEYEITRSGSHLAGRIYHIDTYKRLINLSDEIHHYIIGERISTEDGLHERMPEIFLSVLFKVCTYHDILEKAIFTRAEKKQYCDDALTRYLLNMIEGKGDRLGFAAFTSIKQIDRERLISERFHAASRALMLYIWSLGMSLNHNPFYAFPNIGAGTMSQLADVVSYLIEGLIQLCAFHEDHIMQHLSKELYDFSACLKYGQRIEAVQVRKHLGISRARVSKICSSCGSETDLIEYISYTFHGSEQTKLPDGLDPTLIENARKKLISTKEIYDGASITDCIFEKYINSYNERSRNIKKFLSADTKRDVQDLFLDIVGYTKLAMDNLSLSEIPSDSSLREDSEENNRQYFSYINGDRKEYRILLYHDYWNTAATEIEVRNFTPFIQTVKRGKIQCIIGPTLPNDCIDYIQHSDMLYIEKRAFLLYCLYHLRLKEKRSLQLLSEPNIGYIGLDTFNAIYKSAKVTTPIKRDFFISYCVKDMELVERIISVLTKQGYTYWCDLTEYNLESDIPAYIKKGLEHSNSALVVGTSNYFRNWEINHKPYRQKEWRAINCIAEYSSSFKIRVLTDDSLEMTKQGILAADITAGEIPIIPIYRNDFEAFTKHMNFIGRHYYEQQLGC